MTSGPDTQAAALPGADAPAETAAPPVAPRPGSGPPGPGSGGNGRRSLRERLPASFIAALPALAVHVGTRLILLSVLAWMAANKRQDLWHSLGWDSLGHALARLDGGWYLSIAEHGYRHALGPTPAGTNLVFFPLYPKLIQVLAAVTGLTPLGAGLFITAFAGLAASWAIYLIGRDWRDSKTGVMLVALWSVEPASVVLSMVYTEALLTAFAAWALVAAARRRWITAGLLCMLAGLTRSTAIALVAAVWVAVAIAVVRRLIDRHSGARPSARWGEAARQVVCVVIAPLGLLWYWGWLWHLVGRADAWFWMERDGWDMHVSYGPSLFGKIAALASGARELVPTAAVIVLGVAVVLWLLMLLHRPPAPAAVYATGILVISAGVMNFLECEPRFLLPGFPLLLVPASGLAKSPMRTAIVVLPALALGSAWYGSYLLLFWHHAF
jgi:Dolichyl-phosphate-mannose-protein mannosyltransferase